MIYPFHVYRALSGNHLYWVAASDTLSGCVGQGDTAEAAIRELRKNEKAWLKTAKKHLIIPLIPFANLDKDVINHLPPPKI